MNFSNILTEIEKLDPEVYERTSERRDVLKKWSRGIALTALPFALGSMFKKAYGKGTVSIVDILNYALSLEYLESQFYSTGLASASLVFPTLEDKYAIAGILVHENEHVNFLRNTIVSAGGTPLTRPDYDLSGGKGSGVGPFGAAFSDYGFFLAVAQALEDTGVRGYKGAMPDLMADNTILTAALNIHSVEARHASQIRQMRHTAGVLSIRPWITQNDSSVSPSSLVAFNYSGEDNTVQANIDVAGLMGINGFLGSDAATEAFDEPLTIATVVSLIDPFVRA